MGRLDVDFSEFVAGESQDNSSNNVQKLENPGSIFHEAKGLRDLSSSYAFYNSAIDELSHDPLGEEKNLELSQQAFDLKIQILKLMTTIPAIQKYILERQNLDFARNNVRSYLIRGFEEGSIFTETDIYKQDFGNHPKKIQPYAVKLNKMLADYMESFQQFGASNLKTISVKKSLDQAFEQLVFIHMAYERLIEIVKDDGNFEDSALSIISLDSFMDYADYKEVKAEISDLIKQRNVLINKIAQHQILFVVKNSYKLTYEPNALRELLNRGYLGLCEGIARFDPRLGTSIITPVREWLKISVRDYYSDLYGKSKTEEESIDFFNRDSFDNSDTDRSKLAYYESTGSAEEAVNTVSGTLIDNCLDACPAQTSEQQDLSTKLMDAISEHLNQQQLYIVLNKYGFGTNKKQVSELALNIKVTPERVRQIEKAALKKLQSIPEFTEQFHACI